MALTLFNPQVFGRQMWDDLDWPQLPLVFGQHLGLDMDEFTEALNLNKVDDDRHKLSIKVDCSHFKPEEIEVRVRDRDVVIHGKHEERTDDHGWVRREFTRRYVLPEQCETDKVVSNLDSDGMLVVEAPKKGAIPLTYYNERIVPIEYDKRDDKSYMNAVKNLFKRRQSNK